MEATVESGSSPKLLAKVSTSKLRGDARNGIFVNLAHVVRRVVQLAMVFAGAVQFGQAAFAAWNWLQAINILW
ncbi:hypothetical protein N8D77_06875 [Curtobacterium flaccumfaciens]|uniref:hypothetical protein n=1 Tax=Curtobacterium flaccumfaciens TaxID=2035 RepID=UPI0021C9343E|nr:hypothetical protein [Curtobacterium flaccumfaciens]UXN23232.1 hypothetical protein N8D77_06875 [Curtobacterium flaccumfaciens pv. flaccumfaciens]